MHARGQLRSLDDLGHPGDKLHLRGLPHLRRSLDSFILPSDKLLLRGFPGTAADQERGQLRSLDYIRHPSNNLLVRGLPQQASDQTHASNDTKYTGGLNGVDQSGNYDFVNACLYAALIVALSIVAIRLWFIAYRSMRHLLAAGRESEHQKIYAVNSNRIWPWIKRHVIYAPLFGARHCRELLPFRIGKQDFTFGVLPLRLDWILIAAYYALNIAACLTLDYGQGGAAIKAELRGRSGCIAMYNMIPTVLFALRCNPLIWLLGISYDTFNLYHRWLGRLVALESFVHTLAFAVNWVDVNGSGSLTDGLFNGAFHLDGTIAMLVLFLMILLAWSPTRHAWYEFFVNAHRLMFWIVMGTVWGHLQIGHLPQYSWIQLVLAGYLLEWTMRSLQLVWLNVSRKRGFTSVTIEALPGDACKLTFKLARPADIPPGSFVHVYFPLLTPFLPLTSHPFSVAWTTESPRHALADDLEKGTTLYDPTDPDFDRANRIVTSVQLITKARSGLTRRMYNKASAAATGIYKTTGFLEGPYGHARPLDSYGTVLLFAGGVGITAQLMYVRSLLQGVAAGTTATRHVKLVWSIADLNAMEWAKDIIDELLHMPAAVEALRVFVFVTKPARPDAIGSKAGTVTVRPGRCHPGTVIAQALHERVGAVAVTACGPGPFMDAVREAARRRAQVAVLDYVEEAFTY